MSRSDVYFMSDFHLGARYLADARETERRVVAFLDSIKDKAKAIYLLGDVLDYWYEYRYVVPRGFVRFFGKIAELADAGIEITWMIGNHDIWIFDYLPSELGVRVVDGSLVEEIDGHTFFLSHGDACGKQPFLFRMLRFLFRNRCAQRLYATLHPRWTVGFALSWSRHSRAADKDAAAGKGLSHLKEYVDSEIDAGRRCDFYIVGHLHHPYDVAVGKDARLIVLGDWISQCSYAVYRDGTLSLKTV